MADTVGFKQVLQAFFKEIFLREYCWFPIPLSPRRCHRPVYLLPALVAGAPEDAADALNGPDLADEAIAALDDTGLEK